ncbi:chemotaxis protein CheA [Sinimarinibacterium flocculans]|uniref:chemotaxis protein CheA n=1 Tax=Sinimarinibacterium flocculans TaxID=985250 RepID=UPI00249037C2|nr:chemotaxis protein CheA [Sinimarinibacterium flocculans]
MSGIDLARFHQTFFDESAEGLDAMEASLLKLTPDSADAETINGIFRAAHSIKGGAATFGFAAVADFTHLLETLLDRLRAGTRAITPVDIDVLLRSVDVLRSLLDFARAGRVDDATLAEGLSAELRALLDGPASAAAEKTPPRADRPAVGWKIHFAPHAGLFASGNDPLRILRELQRLGECRVVATLDTLPALDDLVAETCYLAWDVELRAACDRDDVAEVFAWVEDECALAIEPLTTAGAEPAPLPASVAPPAPPANAGTAAPVRVDSGSIRVATEKIDNLVNLVGELVITQAMLQQLAGSLDPVQHERLFTGLSQLERNTRSIQEAVMATRMLPVDFVFSRFPRMVRDLAGKLGKQVRLVTSGEQTEIDKGVIERISDPLTHLVRNAIDHGIETPGARADAGKETTGTMRLSASHQGGHIVVEVADDGRGLDRARILAKAAERGLSVSESMTDAEVWQLIFAPGFSTAAALTDVSGRGVGMDVVKKNIEALNGVVEVASETGRGMRVTIRLPLTLAILDGMSVAVGDQVFILPLGAVVESLQPLPEQVKRMAQQGTVVRVRNEYLPLVDLREWFGLPGTKAAPHESIVVIVEAESRKLALQIDDLVGQQQVVIKSLEANYRRVRGVSGATILGDGRVALIVDVSAVVRLFSQPLAA